MTDMMRQTYIVAVSGGVDSCALLHKLMSVKPPLVTYIVAHVDHGIRTDSSADAAFVATLARQYDAHFEVCRLELGPGVSEEEARNKRYEFLYELKKKYKAEAIITAHHQDDVVETLILNILRGTSARGMIGFSRKEIVRPFINKTKEEILAYANEHSLQWRHDSTNDNTAYTRNYIRTHIVPKLGRSKEELLQLRASVVENYREIDLLMARLLVQTIHKKELVRARFVILPVVVQYELLATWLRLYDIPFDRKMIEYATLAIKTRLPGKVFELNTTAQLLMDKKTIVLKIQGRDV